LKARGSGDRVGFGARGSGVPYPGPGFKALRLGENLGMSLGLDAILQWQGQGFET